MTYKPLRLHFGSTHWLGYHNGRCSEAITSARVRKKDSLFNHKFLVFKLRVALLWLSPSSETRKKTPKKMSARDPGNEKRTKRSCAAIFSGNFHSRLTQQTKRKSAYVTLQQCLELILLRVLSCWIPNPKVPGCRCISA